MPAGSPFALGGRGAWHQQEAELLLPPSKGSLENNVSLQCRTQRQETRAHWCLLCRGNDKHYLAWLGAEIVRWWGEKVVFLHTGSEPVLWQMENKKQNMEYFRNPLRGLETKDCNCKVTRFATLVTAGYCYFSIVSTENDPQVDNPGMCIYWKTKGGRGLYPMWNWGGFLWRRKAMGSTALTEGRSALGYKEELCIES